VDTGGTFTDCIGVAPDGLVTRAKVLSTSRLRGRVRAVHDARRLSIDLPTASILPDLELAFPGRDARGLKLARVHADEIETHDDLPGSIAPGDLFELVSLEEAPILAARLVTGMAGDLASIDLRLGTTKGTNALLERTVAAPAFFVTRGFADLLRIGDQRRPELFALHIRKPEPLHAQVAEVHERIDASGRVVIAIDESALARHADDLVRQGARSAAVALAHSWCNPDHERRARDILVRAGFEHVVVSSDVAPTIGLLARAETSVVSASLQPVIGSYLRRVRASLDESSTIHIMTSAGGLNSPESFDPKDSLLSGPAGGVVGAAAASEDAGFRRLISFDMGGTSTDVARADLDAGGIELDERHRVGDATIVAPALAIRTVAAGGGSICCFELDQLRVGPESAGADPGPACYGAGGPLTITDVNLLLGRLDPARFGVPLSVDAARAALDALLDAMEPRLGARPNAEETLEGLLDLANERMAGAIAHVSARRGYDPADHILVAFGGAAGQHACAVAARLGMAIVLVPRDASLLSAHGIGAARMTRLAQEAVMGRLDDLRAELPARLDALGQQATEQLTLDGVARENIELREHVLTLRPSGQESSVQVAMTPGESLEEGFGRAYRTLYGHPPPDRAIEVVSARAEARERRQERSPAPPMPTREDVAAPVRQRACFQARWVDALVIERDAMTEPVDGPALITEAHTSTIVDVGWRARPDPSGAIVIERTADAPSTLESRSETVAFELVIGRVVDIATRMGETIRRISISANVKERLDFSCAVLDARGRVVASAPHVPVHLGALGVCVRGVRDAVDMREGDVVLTNHPGFGGSHLPDLTTITPVHVEGRLVAYVATRAHHAEIGGIRPGSMSPEAATLAEEGVAIAPMRIVDRGRWREDELRRLLAGGPHPSRQAETNIADIRASVAANELGRAAIGNLARSVGVDSLGRAMDAQLARSARLAREAFSRLGDVDARATEHLDDGAPLVARVRSTHDALEIDFTGSADVHPRGLNAPLAVTTSAVIYVIRLLVDEPIPINDGLLEPVRLVVPRGMLNPQFSADPGACPAVSGGNVETSQRLVDTLIKALGLGACSQGTMNNLAFGDDRSGFYETICGGAGAGPGFHGADAVHTHMTNTRITDVEIVERRHPVRVSRFEIRKGSGGDGRWHGGDGVVREIEFLAPADVSILAQHRREGPYAGAGGEPGSPGAQRIVHANGRVKTLTGADVARVESGDRLVIETPGGGGWGSTRA
jgi:5-oxoprolinase (ATP-hydrolysing)